MKKLLYLLIVIISIVFISNIDVYAKDYDVTIENISLIETSDKVVERDRPSFNNNNLNVFLNFKEVGDYALYKVIINNKENEKYNISFESNDKYIKYEIDNSIIKANGKTEIKIKIIYDKQVPTDNIGIEQTSSIKFNIVDKDGNIVNPSTGINYILVLLVLLVIGTVVALSIKKKSVLLVLLLIPFSVLAIKNLIFTLNTNYIIDMKGFRYNGLLLDNLGEQVKNTFDSMCTKAPRRGTASGSIDYVPINVNNIVLDATSDHGFDVKLIYPSNNANIDINSTVTIETDTDTEVSVPNIFVGECTYNPEYDYTKFTYDGVPVNKNSVRLLNNYIDGYLCVQFIEAIESVDSDCIISIIDSMQVYDEQDETGAG